MKKRVLGSWAAVLLTGGMPAVAQVPGRSITLTQANFPATASTVDQYLPVELLPTGAVFALPQPGANQVWDYHTLAADSTMLDYTYQVPTTSPFSAATRSCSTAPFVMMQYFATGFRSGFSPHHEYEALTPQGLQRLGYTLTQAQWQTSDALSASTVMWQQPAQPVAYAGSAYPVQFPLTATSHRQTAYRSVDQLAVTAAALGLTNAPVRLVHRFTQADSVVGYGTLVLPSPGGAPASFPALLQRTIIRQVDSLYVGSQPAPALLLRSLNMEQGQEHNSFTTAFWRANSSQPALQVYYTDATFQTRRMWFSIWFSGEANLSTAAGVQVGQLPAGALQAYPNPVLDGRFTPELGGSRQPVQLVVRDLLGRQVASTVATTSEPTVVLSGLRPGLYLVEATTRTGQRGTVRVQVQ